MTLVRELVAAGLRLLADRVDPHAPEGATDDEPVPMQDPMTAESYAMLHRPGLQHDPTCDLDEDCTCDPKPLAGSARARYADARRR